LSPGVLRTGEVCLAIEGGRPDEITAVFRQWQSQGVTILSEPHDAGFGLTFLAADPDGNRIRVAPKDQKGVQAAGPGRCRCRCCSKKEDGVGRTPRSSILG
jgi:hypothetical protein